MSNNDFLKYKMQNVFVWKIIGTTKINALWVSEMGMVNLPSDFCFLGHFVYPLGIGWCSSDQVAKLFLHTIIPLPTQPVFTGKRDVHIRGFTEEQFLICDFPIPCIALGIYSERGWIPLFMLSAACYWYVTRHQFKIGHPLSTTVQF